MKCSWGIHKWGCTCTVCLFDQQLFLKITFYDLGSLESVYQHFDCFLDKKILRYFKRKKLYFIIQKFDIKKESCSSVYV